MKFNTEGVRIVNLIRAEKNKAPWNDVKAPKKLEQSFIEL